MSHQAKCFDIFLTDRLCTIPVPPPVFNVPLPNCTSDSTTTIAPTTNTSTDYTTVGSSTEDIIHTNTTNSTEGYSTTIFNTSNYTTSVSDSTSEYTWSTETTTIEYTWSTETTTKGPGTSTQQPYPPAHTATSQTSPGVIAVIVILILVSVVALVYALYKFWIKRQKDNANVSFKDKEIESSQVVCHGKVLKTVANGSVELKPHNGCSEKLPLEKQPQCKLVSDVETPGTPILNVPRGITDANYEDISSSEEDDKNPAEEDLTNNHTVIIRENSQAPLIDNEEKVININEDTKM